MNQKSRTYNSIANSTIGIVAALITIVLNFVVRIVIVQELGEEINGLHNLFQSITDAIAIVEAGFSTAIVIHLYRPIEKGLLEETKAIMLFYKKIYYIVASIFLFICIVVNLFLLKYMVVSTLPLGKVQGYFSIYMLITPLTYLTIHKISILFAEQKSRVYAMVGACCQVAFRSLQILSIFVTHEYYLFLLLMVIERISVNLICRNYVNKQHSYLKHGKQIQLSREKKQSIYRTVGPIFVNHLAANVQNSSKAILIAFLLGNISIVGYWGNYQLICATALMLFSQIGTAITSGFGNLAVDGNKRDLYTAYRKTVFVVKWLAILFCSMYICCVQDFIQIFFGKRFLLQISTVSVMTAELFILLMRVPILSMQNALGLHKADQYAMVIQAIVSLIMGYCGGKEYGMSGLLIGLAIPQLLFTLVNKGRIIHQKAFDMTAKSYIKKLLMELIQGGLLIAVCYLLTRLITTPYIWLNMIAKGGATVIICLLTMTAIPHKNNVLFDVINIIKEHKRIDV